MIPYIVLYEGGSGGDMVCAVIDDTDYYFAGTQFHANLERPTLRNTALQTTMTDEDRDNFLENTKYKAVPSHMHTYHLNRVHKTIYIDCTEPLMAKWVFDRFASLYGHEPWYNDGGGFEHLIERGKKYAPYARLNVKMRDILEGRLIDVLGTYIPPDVPLNKPLYEKWLDHIYRS